MRSCSAHAPALVDVALAAELGDLQRGAIAAVSGFGKIGANLHRHLLLVGAFGKGFAEYASVEPADVDVLLEIHERKQSRRQIDVARWRADRDAFLEIGAPGQKRIAHGPRAHAAVIARRALEWTGFRRRRVVRAWHAKWALRRAPGKRQHDVGPALGVS